MRRLKNILLIDDSISSSQFHRVLLEEVGVGEEIVIKNKVEAALAYLKGEETNQIPPQPDLIFLDLAMPQMDGFGFLEEYITLPYEVTNSFSTIIVVVSDFLDAESFERCKKYKNFGLLEHIRKPMDKEDLHTILTECFE